MSSFSVDDAFDPFEEFDPLAADDEKIDQQDMDDDNPLDTIISVRQSAAVAPAGTMMRSV